MRPTASSISIHALLAESDLNGRLGAVHNAFLSTLSLRRATRSGHIGKARGEHFYPRSPCGERPHYDNYNLHCVEISIHALLAESDCQRIGIRVDKTQFLSTLSLRRATPAEHHASSQQEFLSTLSLRRATPLDQHRSCPQCQFLSTLSLRRATRIKFQLYFVNQISIHALLAESDPKQSIHHKSGQ